MKSAEPAIFKNIQIGEYQISYLRDGEKYTIPPYPCFTQEKWEDEEQCLK